MSLAIASSASATQLTTGASTDAAYSGTGIPSSIWSLDNAANNLLVESAELLNGAGVSGFSTITTAGDLTATNVPEIVTDFTAADNETDLVAAIEGADGVDSTTAQGIYNEIVAGLPGAEESFTELPQLIQLAGYDSTDYPNGLFSIDSDLSVSSAATVTSKGSPTKFSITESTTEAASGGYVLPDAFTLTFPDDYSVDAALIGKEIPASKEANPPSSDAIGTVTIDSPATEGFGLGTTKALNGKVYIVSSPSTTDPSLELSFGNADLPIYVLGVFPTSLKFPLTVTFGEATFGATSEPLPLSSISMSYPAKTSPVEATSCTSLGTVGSTATDEVAPLAAEFGDTSDGYTGTTTDPVTLLSTPTNVTDLCAPTVSKVSVSGLKSGKPTVKGTIAGNGGTEFTATTVTLPKGVSAKSLKSGDLKSSVKVKSIKVSGQNVTVTFSSATSKVTLSFSKKLAATAKLKKSKSLTFKVTVKTAGGTSSAASVKAKA